MKKIIKCSLALITTILLASCIRDNLAPCPKMKVRVEVKDKNYFNVNKTEYEERVSDTLAFRQYVPTLFYRVSDAESGKVLEEQGVFAVEGDAKDFILPLCDCLDYGTYVITVWGGMGLDEYPDDMFALESPENYGTDLYLAHDTITYDYENGEHTLQMRRTKGKLIVISENLPDNIVCSEWHIDGIWEHVDYRFRYHGRTQQQHFFPWEETASTRVNKHILSPRADIFDAYIQMNYYDTKTPSEQTIPTYAPDVIRISPRRNELTVVKYVYQDNMEFAIYVLIGDDWEQVHGMEID